MERYERGITFITSGVAGVARITTETSFRRELSRREEPEQDAGETVPAEENACPAGETPPAEESAPGEEAREAEAQETAEEAPDAGEETRREARELRQTLEQDLREQKEALLALRQQESACLERMQSLRRQLLELLSGPPLEELAALSRSMGMSNDPEVLAFRQQVDRILTMFGAEAFAPAEGEPFDPRRCERFSPDLGREVAECRERWGKTPTELFESLGHFDFGGGGFHCVHMTEHDLDIFRARGLWVITNPGSNAKLASGIAPLRQMRELGIRMAIGTDGPSSNNALDFFREMYLAAVLQKLRCEDAAALPADDVLHMATVGGAQAMGLSDCDVLAPGKQADLIVIDLQRPNMQPVHNAARNLVYSGSKENVRLTMIAGRVLYENGAFSVGEPVQDIYRAVETHFAAMRAAL